MSAQDEAEIHIVPYDPEWPKAFDTERDLIARSIGDFISGSIEHIGSTAIVGIPAKPVIDIMAAVETLEASRPAVELLESLDYCHFPYRPDVMHWFCKPSPQVRTHHLHLVPHGSRLWQERLAFRDYLRGHADVAREYGELKRRLATLHRLDREAYTEAKTSFVQRIVARALGSRSTIPLE